MADKSVTLRIDTGEGRRRAIVRLDEQLLASILGLPDGVYVVGVRDDFTSRSVLVMIEGDALPVESTPPGAIAPDLSVSMHYDIDDQRIRFTPPLAART